jgi:hypothetical protein
VVAALDTDVDGMSGEGPFGVDVDLPWLAGHQVGALTRRNAGLPARSLRLVPIQSRSLPAVLFSSLDGVKSEIKAGAAGAPERRIGLTETAIALLSSIVNDEEPQVGDATGARDVPGGSGE